MLIASSHADTTALLHALRGRHIPANSERIGTWLVALGFGVAFPAGLIFIFVRDASAHTAGTACVLGALALMSPWVAIDALGNAYADFTVTDDSFEKRSPVPGFSWRLRSVDFHSVVVSLRNSHWVLEIATTDGHTRRVALDGTIRQQFALMYPEFANTYSKPLPRWVRDAAVVALVLATILLAAVVWFTRSI